MLWKVEYNFAIRQVEIDIMTSKKARTNKAICKHAATAAIKISTKHIPFPIAINTI